MPTRIKQNRSPRDQCQNYPANEGANLPGRHHFEMLRRLPRTRRYVLASIDSPKSEHCLIFVEDDGGDMLNARSAIYRAICLAAKKSAVPRPRLASSPSARDLPP